VSEPLYLDDLSEGMQFRSPRRTVTESDLMTFAGVSGDFNPLHIDEPFAREHGFGRRVVHGALVLSMATGLRQQMGTFNGSMRAMLELRSWKFRAPVFVGDTIGTETTVLEVRSTSDPSRGVVVQRVDVVNQDGELVQTGELVSLIASRPQAESTGG